MDESLQPQAPEGKSNPPVLNGAPQTPGVSDEASSPLKQIRTFQGDVASALNNQKESLFSIQRTEQVKRRAQGFSSTEESAETGGRGSRALFLVLGSLVFIILGIGGAWYGYSEFVRKSSPPIIVAPQNRFISVQDELEINFASTTKESLFAIIREKTTGVVAGSITHLVMRQGSSSVAPLTTSADLFKKLNSQAPANFVRALDPLFMIGTLGESRFIIFKLVSFENAFPGMLVWEKAMPQEIGNLFTKADELKSIVTEPVFKDVISRNKDVRVLSGSGSTTEPLLLYSFFDNKMLIITDSLETLRVLVDRLTQELLSR